MPSNFGPRDDPGSDLHFPPKRNHLKIAISPAGGAVDAGTQIHSPPGGGGGLRSCVKEEKGNLTAGYSESIPYNQVHEAKAGVSQGKAVGTP